MKPTYDYLYKSHVVSPVDCANAGLTEQQLNTWLEADGWCKSLDKPARDAYRWVRGGDELWIHSIAIHGGADAIAHLTPETGLAGLDTLAEMVSVPKEPGLTIAEEAHEIALCLKRGRHSNLIGTYKRLFYSGDRARRNLAEALRAYAGPEFTVECVKERTVEVMQDLRESRGQPAVAQILEELGVGTSRD